MIFWNWIDDPRVLIASPASIFLQRKYLKPVSRISTASALDLDQHQIWSLHAWLPQSLTRVLLRQVANTGQHFRPSIAPGLQRTWVQWNPVRAADWKFGPQFTDRKKCSVWTCGICNFKIVPKKISGGDMQSARISLSGLGAALANFKVACANHAQTTRPLYALSFHKASFLSKTLVCAIAFPWVLNQISQLFNAPFNLYG